MRGLVVEVSDLRNPNLYLDLDSHELDWLQDFRQLEDSYPIERRKLDSVAAAADDGEAVVAAVVELDETAAVDVAVAVAAVVGIELAVAVAVAFGFQQVQCYVCSEEVYLEKFPFHF